MSAEANRNSNTVQLLASPPRAFGSQCSVYADADVVEDGEIEAWWTAIEASWSRFDCQSDLSRINSNAGEWTQVPDHLAAAIRHALQLRDMTDGLFDPTTSAAAWGYDADFSAIQHSLRPVAANSWKSASVEVADSAVRVCHGGAIDLGGIGKGLVADMTCDLLASRGATRIVVDIGGDVAMKGEWAIDATSDNGDPWARWCVTGGGVATSSVTYRTWTTTAGQRAHHLIDPRTGAPASSNYATVSAHATSAAAAEVAAKVALISGDLNTATSVGAVAVGLMCSGLCDVPSTARPWAAPVMVVNA